jgi:hypothetical protein
VVERKLAALRVERIDRASAGPNCPSWPYGEVCARRGCGRPITGGSSCDRAREPDARDIDAGALRPEVEGMVLGGRISSNVRRRRSELGDRVGERAERKRLNRLFSFSRPRVREARGVSSASTSVGRCCEDGTGEL